MISNLFKPQNYLRQQGNLLLLFSAARPVSAPFFNTAAMRAFTTNAQSRIYGDKVRVKYPPNFAQDILAGPQYVQITKRKRPVPLEKQPLPIKDFINFKNMQSGNEVLVNLDNADNLRNGELISGLIELGRRDKKQEFDWNNHAIVAKCVAELKQRLPRMNAKNVVQTPLLLQQLRILDSEVW